ncbi:hypothetical protein CDAR_444481 [Caerostris darwini]|uniref:Uncharacterized protein n=1 Tax=Caerostris darwini TaxID=1538125 RepID=A0AAV4UL00_9ARAC|nr:hypothetical protein CDAR_444481 [Caerostris darwini]
MPSATLLRHSTMLHALLFQSYESPGNIYDYVFPVNRRMLSTPHSLPIYSPGCMRGRFGALLPSIRNDLHALLTFSYPPINDTDEFLMSSVNHTTPRHPHPHPFPKGITGMNVSAHGHQLPHSRSRILPYHPPSLSVVLRNSSFLSLCLVGLPLS